MGNVQSKLYYADNPETSDCLNQNNQYNLLSNIIIEIQDIITTTTIHQLHCKK